MYPISGIQDDCPIKTGTVVPYGWRRMLWRIVRNVGEPLRVGEDWVAPVLYRNEYYGLVRYKKGAGGALSFDQISAIKPGTLFMRTLLSNSITMPQILPNKGDGVLRVSVEQDDSEAGEAGIQRKLVYILCLYGVLASRDGRSDSVQLGTVSVPDEVMHLWA